MLRLQKPALECNCAETPNFSISGYAVGLATIGLITFVYFHQILVVKTTTVVLTFLLAILIASAIWGHGVSVAMSVAAVVVCGLFLLAARRDIQY